MSPARRGLRAAPSWHSRPAHQGRTQSRKVSAALVMCAGREGMIAQVVSERRLGGSPDQEQASLAHYTCAPATTLVLRAVLTALQVLPHRYCPLSQGLTTVMMRCTVASIPAEL